VLVNFPQAGLADVDHRGHLDRAGALLAGGVGPLHEIVRLVQIERPDFRQRRADDGGVERVAGGAVEREKRRAVGRHLGLRQGHRGHGEQQTGKEFGGHRKRRK
jgi:hypothetical protein